MKRMSGWFLMMTVLSGVNLGIAVAEYARGLHGSAAFSIGCGVVTTLFAIHEAVTDRG